MDMTSPRILYLAGLKWGGDSHRPIYAMRLSIDPLFCIGLSPNAPFFHNFTLNEPLFLLFDQNLNHPNFETFWKTQQKCQQIKKVLKCVGWRTPVTLYVCPHLRGWNRRTVFISREWKRARKKKHNRKDSVHVKTCLDIMFILKSKKVYLV